MLNGVRRPKAKNKNRDTSSIRSVVERNKLDKLLSSFGESRQPPGLVASSAELVPVTFLIIIIFGILAFGIVDREPWKGPDTTGTALINSCLTSFKNNSPATCLNPNLYGVPIEGEAPLFFFISASLIYIMDSFYHVMFGDSIPLRHYDDFGRVLQITFVLLALIVLWRGTKILAIRRESRPADPLGIGPDASTFGNNIGACAVLLAMSCLGVVTRWHEVGSEGLSFFLQAVCFYSICQSPEKTKESALFFCVGVVGLFLGTSLFVALSFVLASAFTFLFIYPWTVVRKSFYIYTLCFFTLILFFLLLIFPSDETKNLYSWINHQLTFFEFRPFYILKNWLWMWWPLWPICLVMLYNLAKFEKFNQPHLQFLCLLLITQSFFPLTGFLTNDGQKFIPMIPLTVLAAFGLLFLPKLVANLLDWFALSLFTFLGFVVWFYWIALHTGFPEEVFSNILRAAPGVSTNMYFNDLIIGGIVSLFWVYLILWRLKFVHPNIWRPVVLSAGGIGLTWALIITLWGPALNINRGFQNIRLLLESLPEKVVCVHDEDKKLMAIIASHSNTKIISFSKNPNSKNCKYLLVRGTANNFTVDKQSWSQFSQTYRKSDSKKRKPITTYIRKSF